MTNDARANLAAAHELLATLSAGRAAMLHLAGAHLSFDRVLALHRLLPLPEPADAGWNGAFVLRERAVRDLLIEAGRGVPVEPTPESRSRRRTTDVNESGRASKGRAKGTEAAERTAAPPSAPARAVAAVPEAALPLAAEVARESSVTAAGWIAAADEDVIQAPEEAEAAAGVKAAADEDVIQAPEEAREAEAVVEAAMVAAPEAPMPIADVASHGAFMEPDTEDSSDGLVVDVAAGVQFSGAGENTANWGTRSSASPPVISLEALLEGTARDADHTQIGASPRMVALSTELSDWAAEALGSEPAPMEVPENTADFLPEAEITPLASEPTAGELAAPKVRLPAPAPATPAERPTLREPRVFGASVASLDMRAAARGVAPRVAGADEIEVAAEDADDEAGPAVQERGADFQVTFEQNARVRTRAEAPRLTEDYGATPTNLATSTPASPASILVDDRVVSALLEAAAGHARRGELPRAVQAYTDALDMRPTLTEAHIGRGRCHLELGDYSSAMSDFARAEDLAPDKPEAHVATGDLYFARKEYKRAIEFYDQAVEIDGSHAMARCRRGISHYYRKNYRQAYQDLHRAFNLDPEIPNIKKYVQMAQKKLERGD